MYENEQLKDMSIEQLEEALKDIIDAREAYPEDSMNRKALALDDAYGRVEFMITTLKGLIDKIHNYVMADTVRKENFSDIEICCEDDNEEANTIIEELLEEYTWNQCKQYLSEEELDGVDFMAGLR